VKSKSELLICYFLEANGVQFQYEPTMDIQGIMYPDFVLQDTKGNYVILEHFGLADEGYVKRKKEKIRKYKSLCNGENEFSLITTSEEDIFNLKERLGKKINETPLKKAYWK
jgi:predicted nuclease of restriction endonuclease-like RecB superfamily